MISIQAHKNEIRAIINSIKKVVVHNHRVTIYPEDASIKEVKRAIKTNKKLRPLTGHGAEKSKFYLKALDHKYKGSRIKMLAVRKFKYLKYTKAPWSKLIITYPEMALYKRLLNKLPGLMITRAEFTIDFMCNNPIEASRLFWLLRKYTYTPRGAQVINKGALILGGLDEINHQRRSENTAYQILSEKNKVIVTIYERGPDHLSKRRHGRPYWNSDDIDRVRWEFKFKKYLGHNKRFKIKSFYDLLDGEAFFRVVESVFKFRMFVGNTQLPKFWEVYPTCDQSGCKESFQLEYIRANKLKLNPSKYSEEPPHLAKLLKKVKKAAKEADKKHHIEQILA